MANARYIPSVTYQMLIDMIGPDEVLSEPACAPASFKWASSAHWEQGVIPEKDILIVCRDKALDQVARLHPGSFLVVLADGDVSGRLAAVPNQAIVVRSSPDSVNLLQRLQNRFLAIQAWRSEIDHLPASAEGLGQLLHRSSSMIGVPLLLYSADGELVARSLYNDALPSCKLFSARKKEILNSVAMLRRSPVLFKGKAGDLYVANEPVREADRDLYYLLALFEKEPTAGQLDMFGMIAQAVTAKVDRPTGRFAPALYPLHALFDELVHGRYVGKGALSDYALNIGFPLDAEFRLLRFKPEGAGGGLDELAGGARRMNGGKCLVAQYDDDLLVLLHSKDLDSSLSNPVIDEQLRRFCGGFSGYIAVSQVFNDIANFGFAYQQTGLVVKYKALIDLECLFTTADREKSKLCYTFEEILRFAIVDAGEMSQELRDFSFSHTILDKLLEEDIASGGDDVRILASYIQHERKATAVADKLHMHRNTVLYRIDKIEKRFGLDFDEGWSRDRVLFDFSILYCKIMRDPELRRKLLGGAMQGDE